jgi:hypothetical protein
MARALNKIAEFDYKLKADQDNPDATVFRLKPLSALQYMEVTDAFQQRGTAAGYNIALSYGLKGWSKFADASGVEAAFLSQAPSENVARLTMEKIIELAAAILDASKVTEAEIKN